MTIPSLPAAGANWSAWAAGLDTEVRAAPGTYPALVGGRLKIGTETLAPEEIGAAVPTTSLTFPASALVPSGGSQNAVVVTAPSGTPLLRYARTVRILDSFDRADNATSAGSTDTGQTWTASGTWGIQSNRLYNPLAGNGNRVTIPVTPTDYDVTATIATLPGTGRVMLMARWADASNYVFAAVAANGQVTLGDTIAGAFTFRLSTNAGALVAGQTLALRCIGSTVTVLVGGVAVLTYTGETILTGGNAGIRNDGDTTGQFRLDDFYVGDDQRASGLVVIPSSWPAFDVSVYFTNLTTTAQAGTVRWRYEENAIDLASGTSYTLAPVTSGNLTAPAAGAFGEIYLATSRPRGSGLISFGITRRNANAADTLNDAVGLLAVVFRQAA